MGLNLKAKPKHSKADSLKILGEKITDENLSFLAELAQKPGINQKLEKNKFTIKTFL